MEAAEHATPSPPRPRLRRQPHGPGRPRRLPRRRRPHFSAHADADQIVDWLRGARPRTPPTSSTARRPAPKPSGPASTASWAGRPWCPSPGRPSWSAEPAAPSDPALHTTGATP
ncbi:MBL fold metallo-hydrolase RNA specificity domain-containing protein [Streptomyces sp. NPDC096136]|uniref:MBL fold metallo-hydrolase RNA specificity domain-containing protein n=1 Tax=Streptomyces sp. NPDC096136 TaxID=3366076 RepID=UPI00380C9223